MTVFEVLAKHLTADVVKEVGAVYRFDVDGRSWVVDLKNGSGSLKEVTGTDAPGDCTIKMNDTDFVALMTGELDGQSAFMGGQLKISGDMMLAMKLESLSSAIPAGALK